MFLEEILGSKVSIKLLRVLLANPNREFTEEEIIKEARVGWGAAHECLERLGASNAGLPPPISKSKRGRFCIYKVSATQTAHLLKELFDYEKQSSFGSFKTREISAIAELRFQLAKCEVEGAYIFGSYATGLKTAKSDIDLLVVTEEDKKDIQEACHRVSERYGVALAPVVISNGELATMKKNRDKFLDEVLRNNMRLYGKVFDGLVGKHG